MTSRRSDPARPMPRAFLPSLLQTAVLGAVMLASPLAAQVDDDEIESVAIPVVQALPGGDSARLNDALGRLGRNPRDFVALVDAGYAALGMGDSDAAIGFFQRADSLGSGNARVRAGIASAHLRKEDPFTAIPLFAEAEKIAPLDARAQMDRALAYDMVGDNATAQQIYRAVLAQGINDEVSRRLALSLAISGDKPGMEAALSPLLIRQDKVAWRTRAFSLAILGKAEEAEAIAKSALPADQAVAMGAYLRYMPRLTPSQQAAAGNLGFFPRAAEIGRDDPRVALYARPRTAMASADRALVPAGQPLGRPAAGSSRIRDREDGRGGSRRRDAAPAAEKPPQAVIPSRVTAPPGPPAPAVLRPAASLPVTTPPVTTPPVIAPPAVAPPVLAAVVAPPPAAVTPAAASVPAAKPLPAQPAVAVTGSGAGPIPSAPALTAASPTAASPGFAALERPGSAAAAPFDLARTSGAAPAVSSATPQPAAAQPLAEKPPAEMATASIPGPLSAPIPAPIPAPILAPTPDRVFATRAPASAPGPAPVSAPAAAPPARGTLADLFADLATPSREVVPQDGAVDIRTIGPARPAAPTRAAAARGATAPVAKPGAAPAKPGAAPAKPSHPSRIWVQLATGRDKAALTFDWRKFNRDDPDVFKGRKPLTSAFGQSNRLLTGPFESQAQANAFLVQLRKAGVNGAYVWTSPAGQVVDALTVR